MNRLGSGRRSISVVAASNVGLAIAVSEKSNTRSTRRPRQCAIRHWRVGGGDHMPRTITTPRHGGNGAGTLAAVVSSHHGSPAARGERVREVSALLAPTSGRAGDARPGAGPPPPP